ncbi:MAG: lipoprotein [Methylocystis sp.]|nr:lipoprotein [Methylocystis sp.]
MTFRPFPLFALIAALIGAASLAGCGRKGPLELPAETQARGAALRAQEEARPPTSRLAPGAAEPDRPAPPIPGTIGHRPPDQYPFLLDPLL